VWGWDGEIELATDEHGFKTRKSIGVHLRPSVAQLVLVVGLRNQLDQIGIGGRSFWIRNGKGLSVLQMHLRDILKGTGDHEARVGKVKALANDARKVQDFSNNHPVIAARQEVGYVVTQHFF